MFIEKEQKRYLNFPAANSQNSQPDFIINDFKILKVKLLAYHRNPKPNINAQNNFCKFLATADYNDKKDLYLKIYFCKVKNPADVDLKRH